jgi:hypothetical protein
MNKDERGIGVMRLIERARAFNPVLGELVHYASTDSGGLIITLTNGTIQCSELMAFDEGSMPNSVPPICIRGIAENFRPSLAQS